MEKIKKSVIAVLLVLAIFLGVRLVGTVLAVLAGLLINQFV